MQLVSEVAREQTLLRVLEKVADRYDVILIDCAPSLGLLTINALTAADKVIMPLECEFFALRGIALLTDTIAKVQDRLNPGLEVLGILGTMYDPRTLHSREVLERVVQAFGDVVFHTVIRRTVKFPETTVAGEPITTYATDSPGAASYRMLAREVLPGATPREACRVRRSCSGPPHDRDAPSDAPTGRAVDRPSGAETGRRAGGSGRVRHDEKITVYVSRDELLALEQARLTLRAATAWPSTAAGSSGRRSRAALADLRERRADGPSWSGG